METLLTVVIPAYNAEKYIKYTLDSLCDECTNKRLVLEKPEISDMEKGETEPDAPVTRSFVSLFSDLR